MSDILPDGALSTVIVPPTRDLGDNFTVRRALPSAQRRMVGPFIFFDQMGPTVLAAGNGLDVRPHPHIGLATVTYLFEGEIMHRDSLGSLQPIRPGEVNWMTAGRGIVHSERTAPELRRQEVRLSGLQCWVALPREHEEAEPAFAHIGAEELPVEQGEGIEARVIAGSFFGKTSPVHTLSPLFYVDVQLQPGASLPVSVEYSERAIYLVSGQIDLGRDGVFDPGRMMVLKEGAQLVVRNAGNVTARLMLLGGEPMSEARYITWNFVSSSAERIEQAKEDWRKRRFPEVPDETEFIPLPEIQGKPVHYP
ncbi:MAG TPA: pirin family protein [Noviherbaspirillum sp.]|jgi:hypothetical protein|uniref:pirin family protein n=1 Tax=Noviherbaspirillum sp. TaxID=1926288 RepID=UPI002DDD9618|nr:pirin family protein [Noviherbaspirillum sp.]HEV2610783.1 pirin family protein [Noviherbaspirillum sp.]